MVIKYTLRLLICNLGRNNCTERFSKIFLFAYLLCKFLVSLFLFHHIINQTIKFKLDLEVIYLLVNDEEKFLMHLRDLGLLNRETRCSTCRNLMIEQNRKQAILRKVW